MSMLRNTNLITMILGAVRGPYISGFNRALSGKLSVIVEEFQVLSTLEACRCKS
jgi:hypothetical protein